MTDARRERWREHRRTRREQFVAAAVRAVLSHGPDVGMAEIAVVPEAETRLIADLEARGWRIGGAE